MKCKKCNRKYNRISDMSRHIKVDHNISALENEKLLISSVTEFTDGDIKYIIDQYLDGYNIRELYEIHGYNFRKFIQLNGINRTNSESKKTNSYINKYKKTIVEKYGVDNVSKHPTIKEIKKQTFLKNQGYENNFCNPIIRKTAHNNIDYTTLGNKIRLSLLKKYGVENSSQIEGVAEKMSIGQKKRFEKMSIDDRREYTTHCRSFIAYTSKLETRIQEILNDLCIEYTKNGFLYRYNFDFIFRNRIVLEIQGDFWHGNPKKYKESDILLGELTAGDVWKKDTKKRKILEKNNYKVYYLWETEINSMSDNDIIKFLKNILCIK